MALGVVADDFTGAIDVATVLTPAGHRTAVLTPITYDTIGMKSLSRTDLDVEVIVVALKSRSSDPDEAVYSMRTAAQHLLDGSCDRLYFKYGSTFDSTSRGNIGNVIDELLDIVGLHVAVVVPSLPELGRTVEDRQLLVHGRPITETSMRNHPLNPMTQSDVVELLRPQTPSHIEHIPMSVVQKGPTSIAEKLHRSVSNATRTQVVIDAINQTDLISIAEAARTLPVLMTGSAGLAGALVGDSLRDPLEVPSFPAGSGARAVLAGSMSKATREQISSARTRMPARELMVSTDGRETNLHEAVAWAAKRWREQPGRPVLFFSGPQDGPRSLVARPAVAEGHERQFAALATSLVTAGARELLVAGGETSGAVVRSLGIEMLTMGPRIGPGLSWVSGTTLTGKTVALALKSGNFGSADMFTSCWPGSE